MQSHSDSGVGGTIGAFNAIRRIGFPRTPELLSGFTTIAVAASLVSLSPSVQTISGLLEISLLGLVVSTVVVELVNAKIVLRQDPVLDFRRLMGIELASLGLLSFSLLIFSVLGIVFASPLLWLSGFLVGIVASLPVRLLAIMSMSSLGLARKILASIIPPLLTTRAFFGVVVSLVSIPNLATFSFRASLVLLSGILVSSAGCLWIVRRVETTGGSQLHYSPMGLFRAFLGHWLSSKPDALEARLKLMGNQRSIETGIISFAGSNSKPKGSIIVSNFHPGPYRDLGSAGLPSRLKDFVSESIGGVVHVPHGISNHELNIISRDNIDRLLLATKDNYPRDHLSTSASMMIQRMSGEATVTGQIFGKTVVLIITLAPSEMEDMPQLVSERIRQAADRMGLKALIIDAHNSITGQTSISSLQAEHIVTAAVSVLEDLNHMPQTRFSTGFANDPLSEFSLEDGIGPGGLSVLTVSNDTQRVAYITIDGNNMQKGFRQEIIESLRGVEISDAEIMTTDTHLVTGLVRSRLGYYPVGAHLSKDFLIDKVNNTVKRAVSNLEGSSSGFEDFQVTVGVLGVEAFNSITTFVGKVGRKIAHSFYWLELSTVVLSVLLIALL